MNGSLQFRCGGGQRRIILNCMSTEHRKNSQNKANAKTQSLMANSASMIRLDAGKVDVNLLISSRREKSGMLDLRMFQAVSH